MSDGARPGAVDQHGGSVSSDVPARNFVRRKRLAFLSITDSGPPIHTTPWGERIDFRTYRLADLRKRFKDQAIQSRAEAGFEPALMLRRKADDSGEVGPINLARLDSRFGPNTLHVDLDGGDPLASISDLVLCLSTPINEGRNSQAVDRSRRDWDTARQALEGIAREGKSRSKSVMAALTVDTWHSDAHVALQGLHILCKRADDIGDASLIDLADRLLAALAFDATERFVPLARHAFRRVQSDYGLWHRATSGRRDTRARPLGRLHHDPGDLAHEIALARLAGQLGLSASRPLLRGWTPPDNARLFWKPLGLDDLEALAHIAATDIHSDIADSAREGLFLKGASVEKLLALEQGTLATLASRAGYAGQLGESDTTYVAIPSQADREQNGGVVIGSGADSPEADHSDGGLNPPEGHSGEPDKGSGPPGTMAQSKDATASALGKDNQQHQEADRLPLDPRGFETFAALAEVQQRLIEAATKAANSSTAWRTVSASNTGTGTAQSGAMGNAADGRLAGPNLNKPYRFAGGGEAMLVLPEPPSQSISNSDARKDEARAVAALAGCWMPLTKTPDLATARSALIGEFPHMKEPIDAILADLTGQASIRLRPTLLVGPPGCGKSHLARRIGEVLGLPTTVVDVASSTDAMIFGTSKRWGNGAAGLPLQSVAASNTANPLIILDEIEKAGGNDRHGDVRNALLPYLEQSTARAIHERYLEAAVNLSALNWLVTANSIEPLSAPLRNRLRILRCAEPGEEHLNVIAGNLLRAEYADRGLGTEWITPLTPEELDAVAEHWLHSASAHGGGRGCSGSKPSGSIRDLKRFVAAVVSARDKAMARA